MLGLSSQLLFLFKGLANALSAKCRAHQLPLADTLLNRNLQRILHRSSRGSSTGALGRVFLRVPHFSRACSGRKGVAQEPHLDSEEGIERLPL